MSTGPRYARRTDTNHAELRQVIRDCKKAYPLMKIAWMDTSNLGGKVGDGIIQFETVEMMHSVFRSYTSETVTRTHLLEFKSGKKKKLTKSQSDNPLELVRIDCRADIFELLNREDWDA